MKDLRGTLHSFHHVRKSGKAEGAKTIEQSPCPCTSELLDREKWQLSVNPPPDIVCYSSSSSLRPRANAASWPICVNCATKEKANSCGPKLLRAEVCLLHSTAVVLIAKLVKWRNWPYHPMCLCLPLSLPSLSPSSFPPHSSPCSSSHTSLLFYPLSFSWTNAP